MYGFSTVAICAASWLLYDVLFLCLFVFFATRMICTYCCTWYEAKQGCGVVSCKLLLVTGVRADSKYSYSYIWYHMYVRRWGLFLLIFHWNISFFCRYLVVGTIFFSVSNNMRRNTSRSDFVRYQAKTWKQPCVAFQGQGDATVRRIASMNASYGYTIVNCVWPHYCSISELAGFCCNKLTAGWRRLTNYLNIRPISFISIKHRTRANDFL